MIAFTYFNYNKKKSTNRYQIWTTRLSYQKLIEHIT